VTVPGHRERQIGAARPLSAPATDATLRRDRWIVASGLVIIAALAWAHLLRLAVAMPDRSSMPSMPGMDMPWSATEFVVAFAMWAVMMVAMMVPSAMPLLLMFATINRQRRVERQPAISTLVFLAGYLAVWAAFSAVASAAQGALHAASLLSSRLAATSGWLSGTLLILAGAYQWTPLKSVCLAKCRSPLAFLMTRWRDGAGGAVAMGAHHGLYCLGCCWLLMALLFVAGVMNLAWVAVIAVFVLVEKMLPAGPWVGRLAGAALVVAGLAVIVFR
jgi:predicted metal-binding membrane protein